MPFPAGMLPPTTTRLRFASTTSRCMMPSASSTGSPFFTLGGRSISTISPGRPLTGFVRRSFGPHRSCRIAMGRSPEIRRIPWISSPCDS